MVDVAAHCQLQRRCWVNSSQELRTLIHTGALARWYSCAPLIPVTVLTVWSVLIDVAERKPLKRFKEMLALTPG